MLKKAIDNTKSKKYKENQTNSRKEDIEEYEWGYYEKGDKGIFVPMKELTVDHIEELNNLTWKLLKTNGKTYTAKTITGKTIHRKKITKRKKKSVKKRKEKDSEKNKTNDVIVNEIVSVSDENKTNENVSKSKTREKVKPKAIEKTQKDTKKPKKESKSDDTKNKKKVEKVSKTSIKTFNDKNESNDDKTGGTSIKVVKQKKVNIFHDEDDVVILNEETLKKPKRVIKKKKLTEKRKKKQSKQMESNEDIENAIINAQELIENDDRIEINRNSQRSNHRKYLYSNDEEERKHMGYDLSDALKIFNQLPTNNNEKNEEVVDDKLNNNEKTEEVEEESEDDTTHSSNREIVEYNNYDDTSDDNVDLKNDSEISDESKPIEYKKYIGSSVEEESLTDEKQINENGEVVDDKLNNNEKTEEVEEESEDDTTHSSNREIVEYNNYDDTSDDNVDLKNDSEISDESKPIEYKKYIGSSVEEESLTDEKQINEKKPRKKSKKKERTIKMEEWIQQVINEHEEAEAVERIENEEKRRWEEQIKLDRIIDDINTRQEIIDQEMKDLEKVKITPEEEELGNEMFRNELEGEKNRIEKIENEEELDRIVNEINTEKERVGKKPRKDKKSTQKKKIYKKPNSILVNLIKSKNELNQKIKDSESNLRLIESYLNKIETPEHKDTITAEEKDRVEKLLSDLGDGDSVDSYDSDDSYDSVWRGKEKDIVKNIQKKTMKKKTSTKKQKIRQLIKKMKKHENELKSKLKTTEQRITQLQNEEMMDIENQEMMNQEIPTTDEIIVTESPEKPTNQIPVVNEIEHPPLYTNTNTQPEEEIYNVNRIGPVYNQTLVGLMEYLQTRTGIYLPDLRFEEGYVNRLLIYRSEHRQPNIDTNDYGLLIQHLIGYTREIEEYLMIEFQFIRNGTKQTINIKPYILEGDFNTAADEATYWDLYKAMNDDGQNEPIPPLEWITEISVIINGTLTGNIPLAGNLFPFSLKYDANELLQDIECLGVYESNVFNKVTKDDIKIENCFMKSLVTWNQWLTSGKYLDVYIKCENNWERKYSEEYKKNIIPPEMMKSIRRRLTGKRVSKTTLKKICNDFNLSIKLTTITFRLVEEMCEERLERTMKMIEKRNQKNDLHSKYEIIKNGKKVLRYHNSETIGCKKDDNTKELKLGLIMYGIYGHYFADIDLNISKSGIENYYNIKARGGRNIYTYRERITGSYEKNGHDGYDRFRLNKKIYTVFNSAHMILDWLICTPDDKTLLMDIPNKLKYYIMPETVPKINMENIDIWDEDCELIEYREKNDEDLYFVADTECVVGERHFPYTISWCELGKDNVKMEYRLGWDCIDNFIKWFGTNKFLKRKVFDKKTKKQCKKVIVYFHNLSYDGRLFVNHEIRSINMNGNKIIQMKIAVTSSFTICLRDSLMIIPSKLANFPKMFKTDEKNKQVFPYSFITEKIINDIIENDSREIELDRIINSQLWNEEQKNEFVQTLIENNCLYDNVVDVEKMIKTYVMSDVKILSQGMKIFNEKVKLTLGMNLLNYISISSLAHAYMTKEAYSGENIYKYRGETRDYIRRAVAGGRCMTSQNKSWKVMNTPIIDMDACSLYPSAMSRLKIPKGKPKKYLPDNYKLVENIKYFSDNDKQKILYRLNLPEGCYDKIYSLVICIKIVKIGVELDFPLIYERDEHGVLNYVNKVGVQMMVDDTTLLELIKWHQIEFDIIECIYWNEGYSTKINHVIKKLYNERRKAKEQNNIIQEVYKLIMNSCYGKCIEKPHLKKYVIVRGEEQKDKHLHANYLTINKIIHIKPFDKRDVINELQEMAFDCESTELQMTINKRINEKENEIIPQYIFEEHVDYDNFAVPVMIGVKVLSESKKIMNSVMCAAEKEGIRIYYQDTDSMHLEKSKVNDLEIAWRKHNNKDNNDKLYGSDMCQFHSDFEKINNVDTYSCYSIFLGKKMYMDLLIPINVQFNNNVEEIENISKVMCRMKGIPLKSIEEYGEDNINSDVMNKINIYERLFNDDKLQFDLVNGGKIIGFSKDLQIYSLKEFKREIKRPDVVKYIVDDGEIFEEI